MRNIVSTERCIRAKKIKKIECKKFLWTKNFDYTKSQSQQAARDYLIRGFANIIFWLKKILGVNDRDTVIKLL